LRIAICVSLSSGNPQHVAPAAPPVSKTNDNFARRLVIRLIADQQEFGLDVILLALRMEMASA